MTRRARSGGGSTPMTGSGATRARCRPPPSRRGPSSSSRRRASATAAALMALVGAAAVVAVGVFVAVLLSPSSDHPSTGGPADTIVAAPVSTLPGAAERGARRRPGRRPLHGRAAGHHLPRHRGADRHRRGRGWARRHHGRRAGRARAPLGRRARRHARRTPASSAGTATRTWPSSRYPRTCPSPPSPTAPRLSTAAADSTLTLRPYGDDLVLGSVPGAVSASAPPSPAVRPTACPPSPPPWSRSAPPPGAWPPRRAHRCSTRPGRSSGSSTTPNPDLPHHRLVGRAVDRRRRPPPAPP